MHAHLAHHAFRLAHPLYTTWNHASVSAAAASFQRVRAVLEEPVFRLNRQFNRFLKYDAVHPQLKVALQEHGLPVESGFQYHVMSSNKGTLTTAGATYVLRTGSDGLTVSRQRFPAVSSIIHNLGEATTRIRYGIPAAARVRAFSTRVYVRKHLVDRGDRVCINIGAGLWYVNGWKNLDHSGRWYRYPMGIVDFEHDLTKLVRMPFADRSVDLFYSEHVFEHLTDQCCRHAFAEIRRSLKPGGGFRIVLPDADLLYAKYRDRDAEFFRERMQGREASLIEAFLILVAHPRTPIDEEAFEEDFSSLPKTEFLNKYTGRMQYDYTRAGEHINWFNYDKLSAMLREAGFSTIRRSEPQSSAFGEIRGDKFDTRPTYSIHVDAVTD